ncbi:MAG: DMT family transporter [Nitratireductor sp.]
MPISRLAPALFVVLWATGFIGARYAMPWSEPFGFLAVRSAITFLLLAAMLPLLKTARLRAGAQAWHSMVAGMLMHGIYLGGVFWAIRNGLPAGLTALIVGLQPLITAIMAGVFLGERIMPRHWLGLAIGFAGVAIVLGPKLGAIGGGVTPVNLAAAFVAVIGMAAGTVWQKRFVTNLDLATGAFYQYLGATLLTALVAVAFETGTFVVTGELIFAFAWLVLVLSIGAIFLLMYLLREGEVSKVASLFYLVPAVTALMAWALFGEELSLIQIAGMAVAAAGVGLATAQPRMRARASR